MRSATERVRRVAATVLVSAAVVVLVWIIARDKPADPIVGSWSVTASDAPFPYHVFSFHADHTMSQANPDAGDTASSDSDGLGTWTRTGRTIVGRFTEITADRTGKPTGRGEISFTITVAGDTFTGRADAHFYDVAGAHTRGPLPTPLAGTRVHP